jgi:hypothetical protein
VTSTPKAKLPFPTCIGVEFELSYRTGLNWLTTAWRSIEWDFTHRVARARDTNSSTLILKVFYVPCTKRLSSSSVDNRLYCHDEMRRDIDRKSEEGEMPKVNLQKQSHSSANTLITSNIHIYLVLALHLSVPCRRIQFGGKSSTWKSWD